MAKHFNKPGVKEKRRQLRQQQTLPEKIIWEHVRNRRLLGYKFRRQYSVDQYIIDFYCPELKLAIEVDGSVHDSEEQKLYDKKRQQKIEFYGIKFIRIKNEELMDNPNMAFERIESFIKTMKIK